MPRRTHEDILNSTEGRDHMQRCIRRVIKSEGGYVHHPHDLGGSTKFGITQRTWEDYVNFHYEVNENIPRDVQFILKRHAETYYNRRFEQADIWRLPIEAWYPTFDFQVNAGRWAIVTLQETVNAIAHEKGIESAERDYVNDPVTEDGYIGHETAKAVERAIRTHGARFAMFEYVAQRTTYYVRLVHNKPKQHTFLKGWLVRAAAVLNRVDMMDSELADLVESGKL